MGWSGAVGLGAALQYLESLGRDAVAAHERMLADHASERLRAIPGLDLIGTARDKAAVISFTLAGVHPHDIGTILDAAIERTVAAIADMVDEAKRHGVRAIECPEGALRKVFIVVFEDYRRVRMLTKRMTRLIKGKPLVAEKELGMY